MISSRCVLICPVRSRKRLDGLIHIFQGRSEFLLVKFHSGKWGKSTSPRKLTSRIILLQSIFTVKEYKLNKGENKLHDLGVNPLEDIGKNSL